MTHPKPDKLPVHGAFLIDKPLGWTSHDAVAKARGVLGTRKVGHAGTLDPLATGLLILCAGAMTKCLEHLAGHDKSYVAGVVLGAESDTLDAEGPVAPTGIAAPETPGPLLAELERLRGGDYLQVPPKHSAKKVGGRPAHRIVRAGGEVDLAAKRVHVRSFELLGYQFDPEAGTALASLRVEVSTGFYVRSLAGDLGAALGCGGYLGSLRRGTIGAFSVEGAPSIDVDAEGRGALRARLFASAMGPDEIFSELRAIDLPPDMARRADLGQVNGVPLEEGQAVPGETAWLRGPDHFRAIASVELGPLGLQARVQKRLSEAARAFGAFREAF